MPNIPANTRIIKCCIPCEPPKLITGQEQASIVRCVASENKTFQGKIAPNRLALKVGLKWVELGQNKERTVASQGGGGISESSWISELRQLPS